MTDNKLIEMLNDMLKKDKDDFEREENKALRKELLQDLKKFYIKNIPA